ncbi:uncharacterized protein LOC130654184 [Hydractinia symbiolongicarpus]|uniref:uncharacterized protein LOC130654184 n=1 Tax=Hydractinia symbiolongicarpus TaxID=13093 RepID=UPI00254D2AAD|nr:uncharacterized protein LOC130654184 [Hydractinia symbiolongicarpus]
MVIHQAALNALIDIVTQPPILAYPNYDDEFFLHVDASGLRLGCILYQKQHDKTCVIGYGSRTLLPAETKYHSSKLEFLGLKWAVTEKFREYLAYADHFTVFTDNNPLLYVLESSKLNANGQRWVSELSEFNFSVRYRPGIINRDADCLSRLPLGIERYVADCTEQLSQDAFRAKMAGVKVQSSNNEAWRVGLGAVNLSSYEPLMYGEEDKIPSAKMVELQQKDPDISVMINVLKNSSDVPKDKLSPAVRIMLRDRRKYFLDDKGRLRRKTGDITQTVLPKILKPLVYQHLHVDMATLVLIELARLELARQRVYWSGMYKVSANLPDTSDRVFPKRNQ